MKVESINSYAAVVPTREKYQMARGTHQALRTLIVEIRTDSGVTGVGEAHEGVAGYHYETLSTMKDLVDNYYGPTLVGRDIDDLTSVLQSLDETRAGHPFARAALETAAFDVRGRCQDVSISQMLGGRLREVVGLSVPLGIDKPETMASRAAAFVERGFTTVKVKVGAGGVARDAARVRSVREAVGPEVNIRVDANAAYQLPQALSFARMISDLDIEHLEQPLPGWDLEGMRRLRNAFPIPLMVDESVRTPQDAYTVMVSGAADLMKIKLVKVGGYANALKIIAVAEAAGVPVVIGQGMCSSIEAAAELHLVASQPGTHPVGELAGPTQLAVDLVTSTLSPERGQLAVPTGPGLGVELDRDVLGEHLVNPESGELYGPCLATAALAPRP